MSDSRRSRERNVSLLQDQFQTVLREQQRAIAKDVPRVQLRDRRQRRAIDVAGRLFERLVAAIDREQTASVDAELLVHVGDLLGLWGVELDLADHPNVAALELAEQRALCRETLGLLRQRLAPLLGA